MPEALKPLIGLWPVFALLIVAGAFAFVIKTRGSRTNDRKPSYPYVYKPLLTRNEQPLYHWLVKTLSQRYAIFAKVRLADVIDVAKGAEGFQSHWNRIQSKHVDFLLCDPKSFVPIAAVELQDASHNPTPRKERDIFVRNALAAAGVNLIEIPSLANFNAADFLAQLQDPASPKPK